MKIFLTGASGFVGTNVKSYLENRYQFHTFLKNTKPQIEDCKIVLHFAGIAHDLKNSSSVNSYYEINTDLTKQVFDAFLVSNAKVFIFLSSVKAVADNLNSILYEDHIPNPVTHYGKSKLLAENYILSKNIPNNKRVFILRPCMIYGPGNKGNLNLLYKLVQKGLPWPLGAFDNKRSFCSIENLCFIINELIENEKINSGIYNVSDTEAISTNELIRLIAESKNTTPKLLNIPKFIIRLIARIGDILRLPLNSERLKKLTENYVVSNDKILYNINKSLPVSAKSGILSTLKLFS
jgi:nucleoside-diphosphate-sugar epimerase